MSGTEPEAGVATKAVAATGTELKYGFRFVTRESLRILLAFLAILVPLSAFAGLAAELREGDGFFFDQPILLFLHKLATPGVDFFFVSISKLGYQYGVIPLDAAIATYLVAKRRYRDALFFILAVVGSLLVNMGAKNHFTRIRPDLWASISPEMSYSFPSGHAMGSATLATALVLLAWPTKWRWWVSVPALAFMLLVGMSRVYLGVHFPSDILAGWSAACAWVLAMHWLVAARAPPPPHHPDAPPAHDNIQDSAIAQKAVAEGRKPA
jgi:membrane-associated phospholipid phosphatase